MRLFRFIFVVVCVSAAMIFTVYLRSNNRRVFCECRSATVSRNKLRSDLVRKQLEAGSLVNSIFSKEELKSQQTGEVQ